MVTRRQAPSPGIAARREEWARATVAALGKLDQVLKAQSRTAEYLGEKRPREPHEPEDGALLELAWELRELIGEMETVRKRFRVLSMAFEGWRAGQ